MADAPTPALRFGSRTDVGSRRERNEDSLVVSPPLFAVADGMGGHNAGDVASEVAVNTLRTLAPTIPDIDLLGRAVESANHAVITASREHGCEGMGTTMTACVIQGNKLAIAQAGDSRAYLLHVGKLQQITRDHSWVADMIDMGRLTPEEARTHPNRSVITRALGNDPQMQPDLYEITASEGDRLLLCSDGLYSMVDDGHIQSILARIRDPQQCAEALVREAISNGGADNVTVIVVDIMGTNVRAVKRDARRGKAWMIVILALLACVLGGGAYGLHSWVHNSAYLADDNGKVAIYQGIPDDFLGFETHWLVRVTDIDVDSLQPGTQSHIKEGLVVDGVDEAERLVGEYEQQVADDELLRENRDLGTSSSSSGSAATASSKASSTASSSSPSKRTSR